MTTRNVLFGGGFDSTYNVLDLVNDEEYDKIFCIYFKHVDRRQNIEQELQTLYRLQETYPNKVEIEIVEDPPEETELTDAWIENGLRTKSLAPISKEYYHLNPWTEERKILQYSCKSYDSYEWSYHTFNLQVMFFIEYLHTKECNGRIFDLNEVKEAYNWNRFLGLPYNERDKWFKEEYLVKNPLKIRNYGSKDCHVNYEDYPELSYLKGIRFPNFHLTKANVSRIVIGERGFDDEQVDILMSSVSCRQGGDELCGQCNICKLRMTARENLQLIRRKTLNEV